jgi:Spy/CpxP family protein refolding chaperone
MKVIKKAILSLVAVTSMFSAPSYLGAYQQPQTDSQQRPFRGDPIRELNLSPEQRERIRAIREELQGERATINQRLRETNLSLEEALDADNPDESVVEQRLRDVAAAQAAAMRMRVLSEVRIRRVLTPEQLITLRTLRKNARSFRRERQLQNRQSQRQERVNRRRGLPKQRDGLRPFLPGKNDQQRRARP